MASLARWRHGRCIVLAGGICLLLLIWLGLVGVRALFPMRYAQQILDWSAVYDLEPAWVASIIRNESRFHPDAVSSAGAVGLMQIMPDTAAWIAEQLAWIDYAPEILTQASPNIAMGTWYLRYLLNRFPTPDVALTAYNAGPSYAQRWEGNPESAFPETQEYLRRVHLSLPVYRAYFAAPWLLDLIPSLDF